MKREEKKAKIKSDIILATFQAIEFTTYDLLSIHTICEAASVSKRTFYSYFKSKDELYLELVLQSFETFSKAMEDALNKQAQDMPNRTGIDQIVLMGETYLHFHLNEPIKGKLTVMFSETDYEAAYPEKVNAIHQTANRFELSSYISSNRLLREIITPHIALSLWAQVQGMAQLLIFKKDWFEAYYHMTPEEIITGQMEQVRSYLQYLLKGV